MSGKLFFAIVVILISVFCIIFLVVRYLVRRHRKVWRPRIKYQISNSFAQLQKQNKSNRKNYRLVMYQQKVQKF